jgi:hypothetical protein
LSGPTQSGIRAQTKLRNILPAIRRECRAGDETGVIGRQKHHATSDLLGLAEPVDGNRWQDALLQHVLRYRLHHFGIDISRRNRIDGDADAGAFLRQRLCEADLAGLGRRIIGLAELAFLTVDRGNIDDAADCARACPRSLAGSC